MPSALRQSLVAVLAALGVALLGTSVQGIAAVDDRLDAAAQEQPRKGVKKDCPQERRSRPAADLRS